MELIGGLFFLVIGVAGCLYPFIVQKDGESDDKPK